uniref:Uncharacterized protein n=1 Tax=Macaca mulatta TaxID=9544 RepID=A0A5F7ZXJ5_MACMU|nr:putative inactive fatty acyl-CoA reductase 2-like protein [Macaca mulatta]XP_028682132.1 putative inactive fatty acyl-CoA reductase 2-like protein [Macaca mulatta]
MLVYHCTSGNLNPCNWGKMGFQVLPTFEIPIPFERAFRRPYADFTTSNFTTQYWNAISHQAPAIIYDFYLWLTGRKLRACACQTSPSQLKEQPATSATCHLCKLPLPAGRICFASCEEPRRHQGIRLLTYICLSGM